MELKNTSDNSKIQEILDEMLKIYQESNQIKLAKTT